MRTTGTATEPSQRNRRERVRGTSNEIASTATPATSRAPRSAIGVLLALGLLALASLFAASPALAIYDHSVMENEIDVGCQIYGSSSIADVALDEDNELVYVFCETGEGETDRIYRYNYDGTPAPFSATKSYISGNEITGNPGAPNGTLNSSFAGPHVAVDNSGGPHAGEIYVFTAAIGFNPDNVWIFKPSGEFAGVLPQPEYGAGTGGDVAVGPDGSVYFMSTTRISKYNSGYVEVARMYTSLNTTFTEGSRLDVDSKGAVWVMANGPKKFEPDQLFTNFSKAFGADVELFTGAESPYVPYPVTVGNAGGSHLAVDPSSGRNDVYVHRGNRIEVFSEGNAADPTYMNAPFFGQGIVGEDGLAVSADGRVFASVATGFPAGEDAVAVFGPGEILPDIHTDPTDVEKVGHDGAEITGSVDLDGGTAVESCELEIGPFAGSYTTTAVPCTPSSFGANSPISAEPTGLESGTEYHYRFAATNEKGTNYGVDRSFTPAYVLKVKTLAATSINENGAMLRGQMDPDGKATEYYFEYGLDANYGQETAAQSGGEGTGLVSVGQAIENLPSGKTYHYRVVTSNEDGTTRGEDLTFRTASVPDVSGLSATDLTETSATLHATINPVGYPTKYRFEYGPSSAYGQSVPVPDEDLGSGTNPISVEQTITGLQPAVTYHFRVVATNEPWGTAFSTDTTFDFAPPTCPNDHARQETAATYLPDCRGYELVSPGAAGPVSLYPGDEVFLLSGQSQDPFAETVAAWTQNSGYATSPPRLMFYGILGTIEGLSAPNLLTPDAYLASRTPSGWVTTLPGLDDSHGVPSQKQCSDTFNMCVENNSPLETEELESESWVHTAEGKFVTKLPQTSNLVPGANEYKGYRRVSPDFTNFAFSSNETQNIFGNVTYPGVAFTVDGQTDGAGSAYDNDLGERTVSLISRLPGSVGGGHIPQNGTSTRPIQFPGISADGSHILMLTEAGWPDGPAGPPYRLYMRVNDAVSYDVSKGEATEFVGMTRDGSTVTFTSEEQLTGADTDNSADLYRWDEATDSLTLMSLGNGVGNTDECSATWTEGCGIEVPHTERRYGMIGEIPFGNPGVPFFQAPGADDVTGERSGDVYFFSPELLDGSKLGVPNQRNLYVARSNGQVQLVASLGPGSEIYRMTISTSGDFAALLTESRLTSYDNKGFRQVYVFDREARTLVCASCRPGLSPTKDVAVSQGGKFMADDGRAFFATEDSLVPRDKNGDIVDVYEYVGGRPQLISTGLASRDFTGESTILGLFAQPVHTGLEAVSRDGLDVYFSTYATIVDEDFNGQFIKFYDARTNGGFAQPPVDAPCEAADECHGADSVPPTPPAVTSGVDLGMTGNVRASNEGRCNALGRKAKKSSRRAKQLRRNAKKSSAAKQARQLRRRAKHDAKQARKLSNKAKACRRSSGGGNQ